VIELHSPFRGSVDVAVDPDAAYALVCDVLDSSRHLSGLASVEPHGDDWRWITKKVGVAKVSLFVDYVCRYTQEPDARILRWDSLPGLGNSELHGSWTIQPSGGGARMDLVNDLTLRMGIPRLFRKPAEAVFARENARILGGYLANLKTTLEGGNGRRR